MNTFYNELKCGPLQRLEKAVQGFENSFAKLGADCRGNETLDEVRPFCFQVCLSQCAQMLFSWHFGFRGKRLPHEIVQKGIDMAQAYFELVAKPLAKARPKMDWTKEIAWVRPYSDALFMTTLIGDIAKRKQFSDLLHPNLVAETVAIPIDPAIGDVLLFLAASFQSHPMDTAPLERRLKKSRKQRPKLLLKAWQALGSEDRPAFVSAIAESTAEFARTTADDDRPMTAVAFMESILTALAYERGWTDLSFGLPLAARLVTRQSLEMH